MNDKAESTAYLSSEKDYITFSFMDKMVRFKGPYSLQRIIKVKEWEEGYLVVDVKYANCEELTEDYIDLVPILERLYIDVPRFLMPIKKVEVRYAS